MKKLNIIFSFVLLSFCLLINVSYASFTENPISRFLISYTNSFSSDTVYYQENGENIAYSYNSINTIVENYVSNPDDIDYKLSFDTLIDYFEKDLNKNVFITTSNSNQYRYFLFTDKNIGLDVGISGNNLYFTPIDIEPVYFNGCDYLDSVGQRYYSNVSVPNSSNKPAGYVNCASLIYHSPTLSIKQLTYVSGSGVYWDGETYYYEAPTTPDEPETPTMPTNAEIASAVQMFYNSVYQLPNTAFKDFVVLYDNTTDLYTYIGHTRGNALGQVIVEPNGYYEGYKFDVQWWKFFLDEQNDSWDWQNLDSYFNYYVYTSDGTIENLNYVGKSNISGLIEKSGPWATAKTVIVYSTNDYPVKYVTFSDDSPDPVIQTGTIQGDQYTYDENLDITDNQYNPLDNFISINYPSTLVGNADFDSFLNTFDENKDVLILPQSANWVILANNSLFEHFSSFIIMCTVFIILQRVMRG